MILWTGRVRVYFNNFEDAPRVWSVDNGDPSTEVKTQNVVILRPLLTETGPREIQPKAWLESDHSKVIQADNGTIIIA